MKSLHVVTLAACAWLVSLPSEAQTRKGLSQADEGKINEVYVILAKATLEKDWTTVASFYLDDAVAYPPDEPAVKGRAALRAWIEEKLSPITEYTLTVRKVDGRDDLAYVLVDHKTTLAPPGATEPVKGSGKGVSIHRRQPDGKWLLAVVIWNSDLPATPSAK
jgi:ketosteroid isomerase-like protein